MDDSAEWDRYYRGDVSIIDPETAAKALYVCFVLAIMNRGQGGNLNKLAFEVCQSAMEYGVNFTKLYS